MVVCCVYGCCVMGGGYKKPFFDIVFSIYQVVGSFRHTLKNQADMIFLKIPKNIFDLFQFSLPI